MGAHQSSSVHATNASSRTSHTSQLPTLISASSFQELLSDSDYGGSHTGGSRSNRATGFLNTDDYLTEDLRNASIILASSPDNSSNAISNYLNSLSAHLSRRCSQPDPFQRSISHRLHRIRMIHEALKQQQSSITTLINANFLAPPESDDPPVSKNPVSYETQLGIHLFFSMLEFLHTEECDMENRMTFLAEVTPVLSKLPPLCLEKSALSTAPPPTPPSSRHSLLQPTPSLQILDSLRHFLYNMASSPPALASTNSSTPDGPNLFELFKSQNQRAVSALAALSSIRGHASDILLLITVLLGVGMNFQAAFNENFIGNSDDEGSVEQQQQHNVQEEDDDQHNQHEEENPHTSSPTHSRPINISERQRSEYSRETPTSTPSEDTAEVMDSNIRKKMEAKKRRMAKKKPDDFASPVASPRDPDVPLTEEERRKIKQQSMPKKSSSSDPSDLSSTPTEEWLPSDKPNGPKDKKLPPKSKPAHKRTSLRPPPPSPLPAYPTSDDDESTLESSILLPPPPIPPLSNIKITPFLLQLSTANPSDPRLTSKSTFSKSSHREVWSCGQNSYGELAQGDTQNRKAHARVQFLDSKDVIQVAAGNEHTAVLTSDGKIYTAGYNDNGQCGQGHQQRVPELSLVTQLPQGKKATQVHAYNGCEHTMVVTEDGRLYSFGYNYRGQLGHGTTVSELVPRPVKGLEGKRVRLVSCSYYHTVITTDSDEAYSFGRNDFGQLGHGDNTDKKFPQSIDDLKGRRIGSLGCGQYHTAMVTALGCVLACGKNDYGQLGVEKGEAHKRMTQVSGALDNERVSSLKCGYYHTIVLAERGRVFGFGRNDYGQLGLGTAMQLHGGSQSSNSHRVLGPQFIEALDGKNITKIAAGCYHSVFASSNGMVYVCGRNNHGQLGTGDTTERHIPYPIDIFLGKRVAQIASGFYHTIILTGLEDDVQGTKGAKDDATAAPFSGEKVLGMPCLAWNVQSCGDQASSNKGLDLEASSPIASVRGVDALIKSSQATSMLNQEQVNVASLSPPVASPPLQLDEISHPPVASDPSTSAVPYSDLCSEVTLQTNALTNQDLAGPTTFPHGTSLFDKDGSVRQDKAALFVLAHLERLARPLYTDEGGSIGICAMIDAKVISAAGEVKGKVRYVVDVCPATFWLLHKLISAMHGTGTAVGPGTVNKQARYTQLLDENRGYMVLSCLRILKANLGRLVKMGSLAGKIREAKCKRDARSDQGHTAVEFDANSILPAYLVEMDPTLPEKREAEADSRIGGEADVDALVSALHALHALLISVVENPTLFGLDATALQKEAAEVLVMGVELFYPNQGEIISLLDILMACPVWQGQNNKEEEEGDIEAVGVVEDEDEEDSETRMVSRAPSGLEAARHFLLDPLLERMASEEMVIYLIPNSHLFKVDIPSAKIAPEVPSAEGLRSLMTMLVREVGAGKSSKLHSERVVSLLMALLKHVMHWAGSETEDQIFGESSCIKAIEAAIMQRKNWGGVLDAALGDATKSKLAQGSSSLLEFTTLTLITAIETLTSVTSLATARGGKANVEKKDAERLNEGVVGKVVPGMVLGLVGFADRKEFALRLLPLVSNLLQKLDKLVNIVVQDSRVPLVSHHNVSADSSGSMSWLDQCTKTTATLCGQLACTLLSGPEGKASEGGDSEEARRFEGAVFSNGIKGGFTNVLERYNVNFQKGGSINIELRPEVEEKLISALRSLRRNHALTDLSYTLVSRQASNPSSLKSRVEKLERAVWDAVLEQDGMQKVAAMYGGRDSDDKTRDRTPQAIQDTFNTVAMFTKWMWQLRSKIKAGEEVADVAAEKVERMFKAAEVTVGVVGMFGGERGKTLPITGWIRPGVSRARVRWRRAVNLVICANRWRKIGTLPAGGQGASSSIFFQGGKRADGDSNKHEIFHVIKELTLKDVHKEAGWNILRMVQMSALRHARSQQRILGIKGFQSLFNSLEHLPNLCILMQSVNEGVRGQGVGVTASGVESSLTGGVEGVRGGRERVEEALEGLWLGFLGKVKGFKRFGEKKAGFGREGGAPALEPPHAAPSLKLELSGNIKELTQLDARYFLLLLDALGLYALLGDCNGRMGYEVRNGLMEIMAMFKSMEEANFGTSREALSVFDDGGAKGARLNTLRNATWGLLRVFCSTSEFTESSGVIEGALKGFTDDMISKLNSSSEAKDKKGEKESRGGRRRCQELITSPRKFTQTSQALTFIPQDTPSGSKQAEFSMSFWLYLNFEFTGKPRSLVSRVYRTMRDGEKLNFINVRGTDRRLDVGYGGTNLFSSNTQIALRRWTHIAVVSDGSSLKLYINGNKDTQRQHGGRDFSPRIGMNNKHMIIVGKCADERTGSNQSFPGSVASLRWYSRALSPIHVSVVYDQGPPKIEEEADGWVMQCLAVGRILQVNQKGGRGHAAVESEEYRAEVERCFKEGTKRVRQACIRIWRGDKGAQLVREGKLPYLLGLLGVLIWRTTLGTDRGLNMPLDGEEEDEVSEEERKRALEEEEFLKEMPNSLRCLCKAEKSSHTTRKEEGRAIRKAESEADDLARELQALIWDMTTGEEGYNVKNEVEKSLLELRTIENESERLVIVDDAMKIARGVAALTVMGGLPPTMRPGAICTITHTSLPATVLQADGCELWVSIDGRVSKCKASEVSLPFMSTQEGLSWGGAAKRLIEDAGGWWKEAKEGKGGAKTKEKTSMLRGFINSMVARAIYQLSVDPRYISGMLEHKSLLRDATHLAARSSSSPSLETLPGAVRKSGFWWRRCYRGLVGDLEKGKVSVSAREEREKEEEGEQGGSDKLTYDSLGFEDNSEEAGNGGEGHSRSALDGALQALTIHMELGQDVEGVIDGESGFPRMSSFGGDEEEDNVGLEDADMEVINAMESGTGADNILNALESQGMHHGHGSASPPSELIKQLEDMGFRSSWCNLALRESGNDVAFASSWILENEQFLENLESEGRLEAFGGHRSDHYIIMEGEVEQEVGEDDDGLLGDNLDGRDDDNTDDEEDGRVTMIDNLEGEGARGVFDENYFITYPYGGGGDLDLNDNAKDLDGDGGLYKEDEKDEGGKWESNWTLECLKIESYVSVLFARACLMQLLLRFPDFDMARSKKVTDIFGSNEAVVQAMKVCCFRGGQVAVFKEGEGGILEQIEGEEAFRGFLTCIVREEAEDCDGSDDKDDDSKSLGASFTLMLLNSCLDDLEAAASIDAFDEMSWGARILSASDSQALLQPNVELASWGVDLMLSVGAKETQWGSVFQRVASCLMSANMPVKEVAMKIMWKIVVGWFEMVQGGELNEQGSEEKKKTDTCGEENGDDDDEDDDDCVPKISQILQLISSCVPLGRLKRIASQRATEERRHERIFMSRYTQKMTQLIVAVEEIMKAIEGILEKRKLGDAEDNEMPIVEDLCMSVLCENAISVTWEKSREGGEDKEEEEEEEEDARNFKYEVEMSTPTLLGPGHDLVYTNIYTGYERECVVENLLPSRPYHCRARTVSTKTGKASSWSSVVEETSNKGIAFTFDRQNSGPNIFVSADGLSARFESQESWSTVIGSTPFIEGVNRWEVKIDKTSTSYLFIGVATRLADTSSFLGGDDYGWGYIGDRALYHKRQKAKVYGEKFCMGDTIGVILDLDKGTLAFERNGNYMGVAFTGLSGELYPAVAFYNQGQRVSLVKDGFDCPSAGIVVGGGPGDVEIGDVRKCSGYMGSMVGSRKMEEGLLEEAWREYGAWVEKRIVKYETKCGFELDFDCSEEACGLFDLKPNTSVNTPRGPAKVVGVSNSMMWLHVDDEAGAWFVKTEEIDARRKEGYYVCEGDGEEKEEEGRVQCKVGYEEFRDVADGDMWNPDLDGLIVTAVNAYVDRYNHVLPWNVDLAQLEHAVAPYVKRMRGKGVVEVGMRFSVLKCFNSTLVKTMPFIETGEGLILSCKPNKPAVGVGLSGLGLSSMLVSLRHSVFFVTKKRVFSTLLERTVTNPKKAEDEYDYPEDLPQVVLNRVKGELGRSGGKTRDPVRRISVSMFGQLFDELHFIDPCLLRIGYTHPMDDGQERTFKVKFEGEGVDDYGGPYREVFGQVAGELQALEDDVNWMVGKGRGKMLGDDVKCELPLLVPTRNWRSGRGGVNDVVGDVGGAEGIRSVVERMGMFVPNPSLRGGIYMEMYCFIGQVIGMALRSRICTKFRFPRTVWKGLVGEKVEICDLMDYDEACYSVVMQVKEFARRMERGEGEGGEDEKRAVEGFTNAVGDMRFVATLSSGESVDLCPSGSAVPVTRENCNDWVDKITKCRLHESDRAIFAMRDGLSSIVPSALLPILTASELELLVCGKDGVDIDLLQNNTEYDDDISPTSPHIESFWRVLRGFDNEDRSRFLKFVWARERLPMTEAEFHQRFKIQASVGDGPKDNPDGYLPKAHTCFFSLNLPAYSCDEVMEEKLLYAIYNCTEMDADFKLAESENNIWMEEDEGVGEGEVGRSGQV